MISLYPQSPMTTLAQSQRAHFTYSNRKLGQSCRLNLKSWTAFLRTNHTRVLCNLTQTPFCLSHPFPSHLSNAILSRWKNTRIIPENLASCSTFELHSFSIRISGRVEYSENFSLSFDGYIHTPVRRTGIVSLLRRLFVTVYPCRKLYSQSTCSHGN